MQEIAPAFFCSIISGHLTPHIASLIYGYKHLQSNNFISLRRKHSTDTDYTSLIL